MSVLSCNLQWPTVDYNATSTHQEKIALDYFIQTDNKQHGPKTVTALAQAAGPDPLPRAYSKYQCGDDYDEFMLAKSVRLSRDSKSHFVWRAHVEYDNTLDPAMDQGPLSRPGVDDWDQEQYQRAIRKDINGKLLATSAGQPFETVEIDDSRPILTYTINRSSWPSQILTYQDTINSDTFLGLFPPGTAKVNIKARKQWENGLKFYETQYVFHFRHDTWDRLFLNWGTVWRRSANSSKIMSLPPGQKPVPLNEDGTIGDWDNPTYSTFKVYRRVPFAGLGIVIA